jgi:hypothetical protein
MKSTVANVALYIHVYLYSVLEMYVKQYTVLTGTSKCQLLFLKEAVFVNKINNLATQSWKKILAFAS